MSAKYPNKRRSTSFQPGNQIGINGRPPGIQNKVTVAMKEAMNVAFSDFIDNKFPEIEKIFDRLNDKDKLNFYLALLPFVKPKLTAIKAEATIKNQTGVEQLSDAELNDFILEIDQQQRYPDNDTYLINPDNGNSPI